VKFEREKVASVEERGRLQGVSGIERCGVNGFPVELERFRLERRPSDMNAACNGFASL